MLNLAIAKAAGDLREWNSVVILFGKTTVGMIFLPVIDCRDFAIYA